MTKTFSPMTQSQLELAKWHCETYANGHAGDDFHTWARDGLTGLIESLIACSERLGALERELEDSRGDSAELEKLKDKARHAVALAPGYDAEDLRTDLEMERTLSVREASLLVERTETQIRTWLKMKKILGDGVDTVSRRSLIKFVERSGGLDGLPYDFEEDAKHDDAVPPIVCPSPTVHVPATDTNKPTKKDAIKAVAKQPFSLDQTAQTVAAVPEEKDENVKQVFTCGEVAKFCQVAPRTVMKWFDTGRIHGYRVLGSNDRRIPRDKLIRFLKENMMSVPEELT